MAYAYEDEDIITSETEDEEELDENLNVKKKSKSKKEKKQDNVLEKAESKLSMDELLATESKGYSIDNLLKEEEEPGVVIEDLLNKKDDKLFKLYLGNGYNKITSKQFNYAAFFLGPIYLLYRKVYMIGFVWLFLNLFTLFLLPLAKVKYYIIIVFELLSLIFSGVFSNQIILNHVGTKILNYKMVEENKEKLKKMIKRNGGVNLPLALVIFIIVLSGMIVNFWEPITNIFMLVNTNDNPNQQTTEQVYFNGKAQIDENIKISDKVRMEVPPDFYSATNEEYRYYYVYQNPDAYMPLCSIELTKVNGYKTPELFISAIASYHLELEENIKTKENNKFLWKYINVTDSSKNIYYATTSIDHDMYLLKLTYQYTMEEECGNHFEEVLNSINNT